MEERTRSPFPGMDPYLENPAKWTGVHTGLIACLWEQLGRRLPRRYYARPEERVVPELADRRISPDLEIRLRPGARPGGAALAEPAADTAVILELSNEYEEPFIEIYDSATGHKLVTVIEILSYADKRLGSEDRKRYEFKQREYLRGDVHLVEIDLLRGGSRMGPLDLEALDRYRPFHYLVTISRAPNRGRWEVYPIPISRRLPRIPIPLVAPDPDVVVDLQEAVNLAYERGRYGMTLDYTKPPAPPFDSGDDRWARDLLVIA